MNVNKATLAKVTNIELVPTNSATDLLWTFPDQPHLRKKRILAVYLSANAVAPATGVNNFYDTITSSNTHNLFLTLIDDKNNKFIDSMPLKLLSSQANTDLTGNKINGANVNGILYLDNKVIQWNKCFIRLSAATAVANRCIVLNVIYQ